MRQEYDFLTHTSHDELGRHTGHTERVQVVLAIPWWTAGILAIQRQHLLVAIFLRGIGYRRGWLVKSSCLLHVLVYTNQCLVRYAPDFAGDHAVRREIPIELGRASCRERVCQYV